MAFHHNQNKFQNLQHGLQTLCDLITAYLYEFTSQSRSIICSIPASGLKSFLPGLHSACSLSSFRSLLKHYCLRRTFPDTLPKKVNSFLMLYLFILLCFSSSDLHFLKWCYTPVNLFTDYVSCQNISFLKSLLLSVRLHLHLVPRTGLICIQMKENKLIN